MIYQNRFHCGSRIWRKLGWGGRAVYNEVYGKMLKNPDLFSTRGKSHVTSLLSRKEWAVVCHNAATTAAWAADKAVRRLAA